MNLPGRHLERGFERPSRCRWSRQCLRIRRWTWWPSKSKHTPNTPIREHCWNQEGLHCSPTRRERSLELWLLLKCQQLNCHFYACIDGAFLSKYVGKSRKVLILCICIVTCKYAKCFFLTEMEARTRLVSVLLLLLTLIPWPGKMICCTLKKSLPTNYLTDGNVFF